MTTIELPADFRDALLSIRGTDFGKIVEVSEIPAPKNIAPFSAAIGLEAAQIEGQAASGGNSRLVILFDPEEQPGWNGPFRLIAVFTAQVDPDLATGELFDEVVWSWFHDHLHSAGAGFHDPAGTVTTVQSTSFGALRPQDQQAQIEVRASWSPNTPDLSPHLKAVANFLAILSGYPIEMEVI